jgi:hypothetical protein
MHGKKMERRKTHDDDETTSPTHIETVYPDAESI